jgi:UDP-GlcNAc3NAcA epimerase
MSNCRPPRKALRLATIVGARPQFIKAAVVSEAIRKHNQDHSGVSVKEILIHTGQHYDENLSRVFFDELAIPAPRYLLAVGSGPQGRQTGVMLTRIEKVLLDELPDAVLVYGDTNSTLAGALAAAKLHIPVAHVEAGLRSFNCLMPEEINRVVTDKLSTWLFCPTATAVRNLANEGMIQGVFMVGDVMFDAFVVHKKEAALKSRILDKWRLKPGRYALATVHRQENADDPERLAGIFSAFFRIAEKKLPLILPLHPRTRKSLRKIHGAASHNPHVIIIPPLPYFDMIRLECDARVILTDSGGVQKEAFFAGVPCVTLRDETEWLETVESGWNYVAGTRTADIIMAFQAALESKKATSPRFYGNGNAAGLILKKLLTALCSRKKAGI